ncbi:MAG: hypothetical protein LBN10_07440 [Propionibacteriaceae bacterium]|jgi:hypothetical protein|nr:hypothetical protein [Propionibacteriaceae bacterium]
MRTTLTLDDDVIAVTREVAIAERTTMGKVISDLVRRALTTSPATPTTASTTSRYGFRPLPSRGVIVTNDLIDQIRDEEGI